MDVLQSCCDRLGAWVAAYRPELFCSVPLALLVLFGFNAPPWWVYAILLVVLVMLVIICSPFCIWDGLLPPKSRILMAAGILIGLLPVSFYGVNLSAKLILWALAAGLWAVALWRRRPWLAIYLVRQSPDVDTVLSHMSHAGDWEAGRAWEKYGCRETRALLHQSLCTECDEQEMGRTYMPVYLLGFLHGRKAAQDQKQKTRAEQAAQKQLAYRVQELEGELAEAKADNFELVAQLSHVKASNDGYQAKAHVLEQRLEDKHLGQDERDRAILDFVEAGHTYAEAGKKYGLSKSGAMAAAKRVREAASAAS